MSHLHHRVSALVDGELTAGARRRALAHARRCRQCREEIAGTIEVKQRMARLEPVDVPPDLLGIVSAIPPAESAAPEAPAARTPRHLVSRGLAGVGAISTSLVAVAYVLGAPAASDAAMVRPPVEEFAAEFADSTNAAPFADPAVEGLDTNASLILDTPRPARGGQRQQAASRSTTAVPPGGGDSPEAVLVLRRAAAAQDRYAFAGVRTIRCYLKDSQLTFQVSVRHTPGQGTRYDVLSAHGRAGVESFVRSSSDSSDQLDVTAVQTLLATYDVSVERTAKVHGRPAEVLAASRRGQVQARFWIDDATGLLLRKALYVDGVLARWSGFSSIRTTAHGFMPHLPPELQTPRAVALSTEIAPALNDKGWPCPERLTPRFTLASLHQVGSGSPAAMHAEYTDGLSTVSVFEERGRLDGSSLIGFHAAAAGNAVRYVRDGLPYIAVWQSGGTVFTVVTDVPAQLATAVISRLPHPGRASSPGPLSRIEDGLSSMADAVAP